MCPQGRRNLLPLPLWLEVLRRCLHHPRRQMPQDSDVRMHQVVWMNRIFGPFAMPNGHAHEKSVRLWAQLDFTHPPLFF